METSEHVGDIELRMLRASVRHAVVIALVLLALQVPMWLAASRSSYADAPGTTAGRLSVLLDCGFALTLAVAAFRSCEYLRACEQRYAVDTLADDKQIRSYLDRRYRGIRWGAGILVAAAILDLIENALLWRRLAPGPDAMPTVWIGWLSPVWIALAVVGAVPLVVVWWQRGGERVQRMVDPLSRATHAETAPGASGGTIIACSGGGIRSASFCLGALQSLMRAGVYRQARAVIGVSGGGYMAAAFHITGRSVTDDERPPFAQGSTELALLRRHTRYLLPRGVEVFRGVMSVLFGVAINVVFILVSLRAIAWVLGWYLQEYDVVRRDGRTTTVTLPRGWVLVAVLGWLLAVALFVLVDKVVDRFGQVDDTARREVRSWIGSLLAVGTATAVLLLGVPLTLRWLTSQADHTLPGTLKDLVDPGPVSAATVAALVTGLVALGRSVATGRTRSATSSGGSRGSRPGCGSSSHRGSAQPSS
ncbi:patatin-like phospholipase domain-containing protein [Luteipulveratus halotolerans]|uniref:PNPLA domain-containing protein n=1 Tax=Luteipulveratus halotolerans TaxID=1631356 RepID=A0A0L6CK37_9MICO|nr:hypothetical protein [Luteipulveratus halotolerans]KNX38142.1 hypothetical protein VV01_14900 [Luteipulveratus halotolerans]